MTASTRIVTPFDASSTAAEVTASARPLYVRGPRNTAVHGATRRHTAGQEKRAPAPRQHVGWLSILGVVRGGRSGRERRARGQWCWS
jgi:hypothetical protein